MTVGATIGSGRPRRAWAQRVVDRAVEEANAETSSFDPLALVERVVAAVDAAIGGASPPPGDRWPDPPAGWADPWLPGAVHEQAVSAAERATRGAWYTPEPVVRGLVRLAIAASAWSGDVARLPFAADPTCGGGAFLLAVLDELVAAGVPPADAIERVAGLDVDSGAVTVSRWSLGLWAAANGLDVDPARLDVTLGDALVDHPGGWPATRLIVGNPPFATPLRSGSVNDAASEYREANRDRLGPYADVAALHLLAAIDRCGSGSTVALVQPQSVLSGRDTEALRVHCASAAPLQALWAARTSVFDASVRVCAPVLGPGSTPAGEVVVAAGEDVGVVPGSPARRSGVAEGAESRWSRFAVRALGGPALPASVDRSQPAAGRLGDLVDATAGFRDEFYGLVSACREWEGEPGREPNRLMTVGLVEPLASAWGETVCRFGRKRWQRPWVDIDALDDKVLAWTERQLVPKVVLATQSRVLEPVVDRTGSLVPATPLIAVHAPSDQLDLVAAVLLAPPVVAWAWERWFGAAMAVDALKLAARQVAELPLPPDREAWETAAAMIADAENEPGGGAPVTLRAVAELMNRAYGGGDEVLRWWIARARLPETASVAEPAG